MPAQAGLGSTGDKLGNLPLMCYCKLLWGCLCLAAWLTGFLWVSKYIVPWITTCYTMETWNQWLKEWPQQQLCWYSRCQGGGLCYSRNFQWMGSNNKKGPRPFSHTGCINLLPEWTDSQSNLCYKGVEGFFFTTLLARLPIAIQRGCHNMFCVLQSSVPTWLVLSLSFYWTFPPHYDILNIQLAG